MLLGAGEGTRLRPLTLEVPKVLLPIAGVPLIEHSLLWLRSHGISEAAINLHHFGQKIKDFVGDGSRFGVKIAYSYEPTLLGTAGGVKKIGHFFDSTFVVVYGDVVTDFDLSAMTKFHEQKRAIATLALIQAPNPWEVGIVSVGEDGKLTSFIEKPHRGSETGNLGSGGVYVLEKEIFNYIPDTGSSDFAYDIFPKLVEGGLPVYGYVLKAQDYLIDIGTIDNYQKADEDVQSGKVKPRHVKQSSIP